MSSSIKRYSGSFTRTLVSVRATSAPYAYSTALTPKNSSLCSSISSPVSFNVTERASSSDSVGATYSARISLPASSQLYTLHWMK